MSNVYETMFFMISEQKWSFFELYGLPVALRNWFVDKTLEKMRKQSEDQ